MGGKGYKPRKDYAGRTVSGDWEDSDRGAGNKATRRSGGKVEKKSPTYLAHVHNKEEVVYEVAGTVAKQGGKALLKQQVKRKAVRAGIKVGGKTGGRAAQGGMSGAARGVSNAIQKKEAGKGEKIGKVVGGLAGGIGGGIAGAPIGGVGAIATGIAGGEVGERIGGAIGKKFDKKKKPVKALPPVKQESFSDWRSDLGEEGYDRWRDDRLVKYGIGHDGSDRKGSTSRPTGKQPKGKTVLQKETEKKYGKGVSALDVVKKQIEAKHGKGAIYDGKKK